MFIPVILLVVPGSYSIYSTLQSVSQSITHISMLERYQGGTTKVSSVHDDGWGRDHIIDGGTYCTLYVSNRRDH